MKHWRELDKLPYWSNLNTNNYNRTRLRENKKRFRDQVTWKIHKKQTKTRYIHMFFILKVFPISAVLFVVCSLVIVLFNGDIMSGGGFFLCYKWPLTWLNSLTPAGHLGELHPNLCIIGWKQTKICILVETQLLFLFLVLWVSLEKFHYRHFQGR